MSQEPVHSFSFASAQEAADEMYGALPKGKRLQYLGHLNEILVVMAQAAEKMGVKPGEQSWRVPVAILAECRMVEDR